MTTPPLTTRARRTGRHTVRCGACAVAPRRSGRRPGHGTRAGAVLGALLVLLAATAAGAQTAPDRVPLPSGLSFEDVRRTLAWLRPVPGQDSASSRPDGSVGRIDGLIVDETITKIGRDFYDVFYGAWEAPPGAANFTLRIQEQPMRGLGTRIVLLLNDEPLFQLQLQPRYDVVADLAMRAAAYTSQELARRRPAEMPTAAGDPGGGAG